MSDKSNVTHQHPVYKDVSLGAEMRRQQLPCQARDELDGMPLNAMHSSHKCIKHNTSGNTAQKYLLTNAAGESLRHNSVGHFPQLRSMFQISFNALTLSGGYENCI